MKTFSSVSPKAAKQVGEAILPLICTAEDLRTHIKMAMWNMRMTVDAGWIEDNLRDLDNSVCDLVRSIGTRLEQIGEKPVYTLEDVARESQLRDYPLAETQPARVVAWVGECSMALSEVLEKVVNVVAPVDAVTAHHLAHLHMALECAAYQLWRVSQTRWVQEMPGPGDV